MQYNEDPRSREAIGKRIADLREKKKLTQEKLGKILFTNRSNINNYEHGKGDISIELIMALSDIFDISTDYILTEVPPENRTVAADLGLSNNSIEYLKMDNAHIHNCLNFILTHTAGRNLLFQIGWYIGLQFDKTIQAKTTSGQTVDIKEFAVPGIDKNGDITSSEASIKENPLKVNLSDVIERSYLDKMLENIRQLKDAFQEEAAINAKQNGGKKNAEEE